MRTLVSANMVYRYKNWQVRNSCKQVVKGTHWLKGRIYYHNLLRVNFKNNRHHPNKRY